MLYEADGGSTKKSTTKTKTAAQLLQEQAARAAAQQAEAQRRAAAAAAAAKAAAPKPTIAQQYQQLGSALTASGVKDLAGTPIKVAAPTPVKTTVSAPVKTTPTYVAPVQSAPVVANTGGTAGGGGGSAPSPIINNTVNTDNAFTAPYEPDHPRTMPAMRTGSDMARQTGVIYDRNEFLRQMKNALEAKYANLGGEYDRLRSNFHGEMGVATDQMMAGLRRGDQAATMTGLTAGSNTAERLMALQGVSQNAAQGATDIAQTQADLVYKKESDLANAEENATKMYNELGLGLGQLSRQELDSRVQGYGMNLARMSAEEVAKIQADAHKFGATTASAAQIAAANASKAGMEAQAAATVTASQNAANAYKPGGDNSALSADHLIYMLNANLINPDEFYAEMVKRGLGRIYPGAKGASGTPGGAAGGLESPPLYQDN